MGSTTQAQHDWADADAADENVEPISFGVVTLAMAKFGGSAGAWTMHIEHTPRQEKIQ